MKHEPIRISDIRGIEERRHRESVQRLDRAMALLSAAIIFYFAAQLLRWAVS